jgi:hypothetical protein
LTFDVLSIDLLHTQELNQDNECVFYVWNLIEILSNYSYSFVQKKEHNYGAVAEAYFPHSSSYS